MALGLDRTPGQQNAAHVSWFQRRDLASHLAQQLGRGAIPPGHVLATAKEIAEALLDRRSDFWAFGWVLYEMLTARQPMTMAWRMHVVNTPTGSGAVVFEFGPGARRR
jgi:hypothetical protein